MTRRLRRCSPSMMRFSSSALAVRKRSSVLPRSLPTSSAIRWASRSGGSSRRSRQGLPSPRPTRPAAGRGSRETRDPHEPVPGPCAPRADELPPSPRRRGRSRTRDMSAVPPRSLHASPSLPAGPIRRASNGRRIHREGARQRPTRFVSRPRCDSGTDRTSRPHATPVRPEVQAHVRSPAGGGTPPAQLRRTRAHSRFSLPRIAPAAGTPPGQPAGRRRSASVCWKRTSAPMVIQPPPRP